MGCIMLVDTRSSKFMLWQPFDKMRVQVRDQIKSLVRVEPRNLVYTVQDMDNDTFAQFYRDHRGRGDLC